MKVTLTNLVESFASPSRVERDEKTGAIVLRGVKFLGERSTNLNADGTVNVYPLEARKKAQALYEGVKVYRNHPPRTNPGQERGIEEQLGRLRNVRTESDGSYGDLYLNPKHELAEAVAWSAEHSPDDLGLSHNAQGYGEPRGKELPLTEISFVRSVDVVTAGATTHSLFESRQDAGQGADMDPRKTLLEALHKIADLREACDENALLELLTDDALMADEKVAKALALLARGNMAASEDDESGDDAGAGDEGAMEGRRPRAVSAAVTELQESNRQLRLKLEALEAEREVEKTRRRRESMLEEAKLPAKLRGPAFLESVYGAETDAKAQALIDDWKRLVHHQQPVSGLATVGGGEVKSVSAFLEGKE